MKEQMIIKINLEETFQHRGKPYYPARTEDGNLVRVFVPHELDDAMNRKLKLDLGGRIPQEVFYPPAPKGWRAKLKAWNSPKPCDFWPKKPELNWNIKILS